jgi:hypothetical protein
MNKKPTIDISIGKDGKVKVKVHGVSGKECTNLTDAIAKIIGREESRMLTSEYRQGSALTSGLTSGLASGDGNVQKTSVRGIL